MTFQHPQLLWLLVLPAILLAWEGYRVFRILRLAADPARSAGGKILAVAAGANTARLTPGGAASLQVPRRAGCWCLAAALVCAAVALARPQWGRIEEPVFDQSREILIAVDLSRSMLADDVKPSRLERARMLIENLLVELKGERAGLIVFAGTAFLQVPLSGDYEILREILPTLNPGYLPQAGTNYAALLQTALDSMGKGSADRFLIVLSDGEADPDNPWRPLAEDCKKRGIRALTLGIGTAAGAMLPDAATGGLLKDARGAVVLSRLEPATLQELAGLTDGAYADASQWVDIAALVSDTVAKGRRGDFKDSARVRLAEHYQWALAPALLFLLLSLWREFPVRPRPRRIALVPSIALAAAALLFPASLESASIETLPAEPPVSVPMAPDPSTAEADARADAESAAATAKLSSLVGRLSEQSALSSKDAVELGEATLAFGEPLRAGGKPVPTGPVDDALEAVRRAAKADPSGADWAKLRERLEALREEPSKQEQQQQQQKDKKDDQKKSDADKQQQDQQKQSGGEGEKDSKQDQQQQGGEGEKKDGEKKEGEKKDGGQDAQSGQKGGKEDSQNGKSSDKDGQPNEADGQKKDTKDTGGADESKAPPPKPEGKPGERAFGDMRDEGKKNEERAAKPAEGQEQAEKQAGTQRVGGVPAQGSALDKNVDPKLLAPLQRLERVKGGDSPARLFQRMNGETPPDSQTGRTW